MKNAKRSDKMSNTAGNIMSSSFERFVSETFWAAISTKIIRVETTCNTRQQCEGRSVAAGQVPSSYSEKFPIPNNCAARQLLLACAVRAKLAGHQLWSYFFVNSSSNSKEIVGKVFDASFSELGTTKKKSSCKVSRGRYSAFVIYLWSLWLAKVSPR